MPACQIGHNFETVSREAVSKRLIDRTLVCDGKYHYAFYPNGDWHVLCEHRVDGPRLVICPNYLEIIREKKDREEMIKILRGSNG